MSSTYPRYIETGIDWLGSIPSHWEAKRLRWAATLITEKASDTDYAIGLEHIESWSGRVLDTESEYAGDGISIQPGDVLFGKLRPYLAKVALADRPGGAVGDFHVLRPSSQSEGRFLQLQMLTPWFISVVDGSTYGAKMPRASWSFVSNIVLALPPLDEQRAIAAFLDRETGKIDALVEEQRRLIALLKEKRQAVISHAVTKGLDPTAPLKPSGIDWLGDIPAHWEVVQVRRIVRQFEQGWSPECFSRPAEPGEWGVLKTGCVNGGFYREQENKALPPETPPEPELQVRKGDVLMSRASGSPDLIGSVARVNETAGRIMLSDKIFRLRLEPHADPGFVVWAFASDPVRDQIIRAISGAEGMANNLPQSKLKAFSFVLPPPEEQARIVSWLKQRTLQIDDLIREAETAIDLLQERRSALISAAVTGKIDVRPLVPEATEAA